MGEGKELGAVEPGIEVGEVEQSVVAGDGDELEPGTGALGKELPRDKVTVVLHLGEQDDVALGKVVRAPCGGNEVDGLGGATSENDVLARGGIEETSHAVACVLIGGGGTVAELVDAAVDVGIVVLIIFRNCLQYGAWFLSRGGIVEID